MKQHPIPVGRGSIVGRVLQDGCSAQIADVFADSEYTSELKEAAKIGGANAIKFTDAGEVAIKAGSE